MNKIFILLSFLIVSSMVFISCFQDDCMNAMGYNNCIVLDNCNNNSDCSENQFCSLYDGKCHENPCVHENITCGLGECVINETGGYSCECNEDGGKIDNTRRCLLKCNSYKDCVDFKPDGDRVYPVCSDTINGGVCNLATCHGDDSCPDGKVCNEERNLCE